MPQAIAHGDPLPNSAKWPADWPLSLADALSDAAQTSATLRYLEADGAETIQSYAELQTAATQIAAGLNEAGLSAGNLIILQLPKSADLLAALWACFLGGYIPVPVSVQIETEGTTPLAGALQLVESPVVLTEKRIERAIASQLSPAETLLTIESLSSSVSPLQTTSSPRPNDTALLLLTSGSTGRPKGVQLTHQNLRASTYGMATINGLSATDITLNWMPLEHVASLVMFHLTEVYLGCDQIHVARERVLKNPLVWLDLLDRYRVSATWAPNFAYGLVNDRLSEGPPGSWDLSALRWMGNGAEAVVGKTARRFLQLMHPYGLAPNAVSPGYGMSETCSGIVHSRNFSLASTAKEDSFVALGQPIPGVSVRIVDASDAVVLEGTIGRLQVKGATVMSGYYRRPDLDREVFVGNWFNTGDLGFLEGGCLTLTGREKDAIILNGINYYSHEIESVVETLEGVEVSFTAACGVRAEDEPTEQLAVFFCPVDDIPTNEEDWSEMVAIARQIRTQIINQIGISPAYVIPLEQTEIPKTAIGKIQRSQLAQRFQSGSFKTQNQRMVEAFQRQTKSAHTLNNLEQQIAQIWQSVLQKDEPIPLHTSFFDLGGTSLRLMQVLGHLQNQIDPTLPAVALFQYSTVASLANYLKQASSSNRAAQIKVRSRKKTTSTDIAIIGMAGRFPGAQNLDEFWQNLCNGVESITFFSDEEMLSAGIEPALLAQPNYVNASPTLKEIDRFDAAFFDYSPKEAELMDPQQRLLLECAWESLETAGYNPFTYAGDIGLYAGASMNTYLLNHVYPQRHTLDPNDSLNVFTLSSLGGFQATVANDKDYLTTRVSYKLNLRGPSVNVQTACSTSLVSIHLAAQSLLQNECDLALAGGVSVETPQKAGYLYQEGMILSKDGHCRAFDASSQGTLFGSGVGLVVLKRLDEAIADKDFIYAAIKGSAIGNDGGQKVGYLAPLGEGQARVAAEALNIAQISPNTLGYVEAHGTGTQLGDPIEITGLSQAFRLSTEAKRFCPIGSVKTNVGHLNIASGVVGFIKTALAVHYGKIPPSLHFQRPNPQIDFANSPFYVNTALADWPQKKTPRRASVNALGIGGTNAHIVLEEVKSTPEQPSDNPNEINVFTLSAKNPTALRTLAQKYLNFLSAASDLSLEDLCFTAAVGRSHFSHRTAFTTTSVLHLQSQLQNWLSNKTNPAPSTPPTKVTFLFTGQGAQSMGMGYALYNSQPVFQKALDRCAKILLQHDIPLLDILYGEKSDRIHQTNYTQPVLFSFEYALAQLWISWGIQPSLLIGHSLGEYVAACLARVMSLKDSIKLVTARGRLMQALPSGGAMVSVMADEKACEEIAQRYELVDIAAVNGPQSTVLSGDGGAIAQIINQLKQQNIKHKQLKVSHGFHSSLMEPMLAEFRKIAASVTYQQPEIDIVSNLTGNLIETFSAEHWANHIRQPVLFSQGIKTLHSQGTETFLECGPRHTLITLAQTTLPAPTYHWLPSLNPKHPNRQQILSSLAQLYEQGHPIDWAQFYQPQSHQRIPLPTYPFQRQRHWIERPARPILLSSTPAHPLLGPSIPTPLKQQIFQQTIASTQPAFLAGHQVHAQTVLPGAAYLEIAVSASSQSNKVRLRNVAISKALYLIEQPVSMQTILNPEASRFEIYSRSKTNKNWTLHCEGIYEPIEESPEPLSIESVKQALGEGRSGEEHYAICKRLGLNYGGAFCGVRSLWRKDGSALGRIEVPNDCASYHLHPAALDACMQCVLAALPEAILSEAYVPIGIDSFSYYSALTQGQTIWSEVNITSALDAEIVTANVRIVDEAGRAIALLSGLAAKRISNPSQDTHTWQNWLYQIEWHPTPIGSIASSKGNWLVVSNNAERLDPLSTRLAEAGKKCTKMLVCEETLKNFNQFEQTVSGRDWQGIIYWGDNEESDRPEESTKRNCKTLLFLTQAIANYRPAPHLWIVTCGAQALSKRESSLSIAQAPLGSMGKTIALEHLELNCVCLDLDPEKQHQQLDELVAEINSTIGQGDRAQIAYRNGTRYRAKLAKLPLSEQNQQLQISTRGTLEQLQWKETKRQPPQPDQIEIAVQATGLNFRDVLNALDMYPGDAGALGLECVGEVVAVGADVRSLQIGDVVMGIAPASFARFVTLPESLAIRKPKSISPEAAATIPTAFLTAYYALVHLGQLKAGEAVLIHSAAGGVGQAAVQIAQQIGAEVYATASPPKWDLLKQQGIQHIFNSRDVEFASQIQQQTQGKGVFLVLNSLSGETISKSLSVLSPQGRFLEIGKADIWPIEQMAQQRPDVDYQVVDLVAVTRDRPQLIQSMLQSLANQFHQGDLHPLPMQTFQSHQAIEAFRFMQQARHVGKVVITPPASVLAPSSNASIDAEATYLITGGLGALGLQLAQWLVDEGARNLVLIGRTAPSKKTRQMIQKIESAKVSVQVLRVDIADLDSLKKALSSVLQSSTPLKGVFHLAGQIDDRLLSQQTWKSFERVMAAKVAGTWHLHKLTQNLELDHFVMFSSAASLVGSVGQVNYAAANGFLDAIAHYRHQLGLPALSINWGAWAGAGLAADDAVRQRLKKAGIPTIQPETGLAALKHLMTSCRLAQVGVLPGELTRWTQAVPGKSQQSASTTSLKLKIQSAAADERAAMVSEHLIAQVAIVLGVKTATIDDFNSSFTELGLDSLTAVELRDRLQASLDCTLSATLVYDYPTLADLRDYLTNLLSPSDAHSTTKPILSSSKNQAVEELSEAEAEALLMEELRQLEDS